MADALSQTLNKQSSNMWLEPFSFGTQHFKEMWTGQRIVENVLSDSKPATANKPTTEKLSLMGRVTSFALGILLYIPVINVLVLKILRCCNYYPAVTPVSSSTSSSASTVRSNPASEGSAQGGSTSSSSVPSLPSDPKVPDRQPPDVNHFSSLSEKFEFLNLYLNNKSITCGKFHVESRGGALVIRDSAPLTSSNGIEVVMRHNAIEAHVGGSQITNPLSQQVALGVVESIIYTLAELPNTRKDMIQELFSGVECLPIKDFIGSDFTEKNESLTAAYLAMQLLCLDEGDGEFIDTVISEHRDINSMIYNMVLALATFAHTGFSPNEMQVRQPNNKDIGHAPVLPDQPTTVLNTFGAVKRGGATRSIALAIGPIETQSGIAFSKPEKSRLKNLEYTLRQVIEFIKAEVSFFSTETEGGFFA